MLFIVGLDDFITKLSQDSTKKLMEIFGINQKLLLLNVTIIDSSEIIKKYAYEDWFKNNVDLARGIWVGSGISYQSLFKTTNMERASREDIENTFGYVIQNGKGTLVKLLTDFVPHDI